MGRPKLTRRHYQDNFSKYSTKRTKYTPETFHAEKNQCSVCDGTHFFHEKQQPPTQRHYRTYGYQTIRVLWRIKCANPSCYQPYGVILKPEYHDSAGE